MESKLPRIRRVQMQRLTYNFCTPIYSLNPGDSINSLYSRWFFIYKNDKSVINVFRFYWYRKTCINSEFGKRASYDRVIYQRSFFCTIKKLTMLKTHPIILGFNIHTHEALSGRTSNPCPKFSQTFPTQRTTATMRSKHIAKSALNQASILAINLASQRRGDEEIAEWWEESKFQPITECVIALFRLVSRIPLEK